MIVSFNVEDELKKWLDEFNEKLESEIKVCKVGLSKIIGYMIRKAIENEEEFRKEFLTWLISQLTEQEYQKFLEKKKKLTECLTVSE